MSRSIALSATILVLISSCTATAQQDLSISRPDGVIVRVINKDYPLLKILLPGEPASERGIEVEFPEHVTGLNKTNNASEHLYLVTRGASNKRTLPQWRINGDSLVYECELNNSVTMIASAYLETDGLRYNYRFTNHSGSSYQNLQAVTCVKQYSSFSDTLLERTYVHHDRGFDLLASETPQRLTMPLNKWLPCRYLVSCSWPVVPTPVTRGADSITRYNKSVKADKPFIATLSHNKEWIAATCTKDAGNIWTNPERSCQHADPSVDLNAGETKSLELKTFLIRGDLEKLLELVNAEMNK